MTPQATDTTYRTELTVRAPAARAFEVFTTGIGSWWPVEHHLLDGPVAEMVFEPRVGGHVIDRSTDGRECRWARVLAFEPPHRFVITWDISLQWQIETDPDKCSEIEVRFVPEGPDATRVELEHRHLERHGDGWEQMRGAIASPDGWELGLSRFAAVLDD